MSARGGGAAWTPLGKFLMPCSTCYGIERCARYEDLLMGVTGAVLRLRLDCKYVARARE
jgi:hypothetical protein